MKYIIKHWLNEFTRGYKDIEVDCELENAFEIAEDSGATEINRIKDGQVWVWRGDEWESI